MSTLRRLSCIIILFLIGNNAYALDTTKQYKEYFIAINKATEEFSEDSLKAISIVNDIKLSKISSEDSLYINLVFAKLNFFKEYGLDERMIEESKLLIKSANKQSNLDASVSLHTYLADYFLENNLLDSSYIHVNQAIAILDSFQLNQRKGKLLLTKAVIYYSKNEYIKSIETVFKAADIFKETNQEMQMAFAYLQIGSTYLFINYLDEAETYYKLASSNFLKLEDTLGYAICNSNLGLIEYERKNYDQAISLLKEAQIEILKSGRKIMIGFAYQSLGECYLKKEMYDSSFYYIKKSSAINEALKYPYGISKDYYVLAEIYNQIGKADSSLHYAEESQKLLEIEGDNEIELNLSMLLANLYQANGQIEKSNLFLRKRIAIADSIVVERSYIDQLSQIENRKLKEAEYALKISREKEKSSHKEQQYQSYIIIFLILLLTGILGGFIFLYIANRSNKILNHKLTKELAKNQSLIQEIHHRVKNNLQIISSMLSMQSRYVNQPKLEGILNDCRKRIDSMALIHESLYKGEDNISPSFDNYIQKLIPLLIETYFGNSSKIELQTDVEELTLSLDESIPCGLIINEVITNCLKHAFPTDRKGKIRIAMSVKNGNVHLEITDNGVGLPENFDARTGDTFGFVLIQTLAKQLEANLSIESEKDQGVNIKIDWKARPVTKNEVGNHYDRT